jgi:hypothetical protein
MSALRDIQTIPWIFKYNTRIFFETGTGLGSGLMRMIQPEYGQNLLISCDIDKDLAEHSARTFSFDTRVNIFNEEGPTLLRALLPRIPLDSPIFFWLDSHFANSDYNLGHKPLTKHSDGDPDVRLPALNELKIIKELRTDKGAKDFILLDDAMLYDELDRYEDSVSRLGKDAVPDEYRKILNRSIEMFKDTHTAQVITIAQGFLALHPKQ